MRPWLALCICRVVCALTSPVWAQCPGQFTTINGSNGPNNRVFALAEWDPDGPGPMLSHLIAGGEFTVAGHVKARRIAGWDGTSWYSLGEGFDAPVYALCVYNGQLHAAGEFLNAGGTMVNRVARWNGSAWEPLDAGVSGPVHALEVFNGELIVGGKFQTAGGLTSPNLARWNGSGWLPLGTQTTSFTTAVYSLRADGATLLVGGERIHSSPSTQFINRWNGSQWLTFPELFGPVGPVRAIAIQDGTIYVGVATTYDSTVGQLLAYSGSTWQEIGGLPRSAGAIFSLHSHTGEMYAGGAFQASSFDNFARVNGTSLAYPLAFTGSMGLGTVHAVTTFRGSLIAAGKRTHLQNTNLSVIDHPVPRALTDGISGSARLASTSDGIVAFGFFRTAGQSEANSIARFDGTAWTPLGTGVLRTHNGHLVPGAVGAVAETPTGLVIGGSFHSAGTMQANNVAQWSNATGWSPLGAGLNDSVSGIAVFEGDAIVVGRFTASGASPCRAVARWTGSEWLQMGATIGGASDEVVGAAIRVVGDELFLLYSRLSGQSFSVHIAQWDGAAWQNVGLVNSGGPFELSEFEGDLAINAAVTMSNGTQTRYLARYSQRQWLPIGYPPAPTTTLAEYDHRLYVRGFGYWDSHRWLFSLHPPHTSLVAWNGDLYGIALHAAAHTDASLPISDPRNSTFAKLSQTCGPACGTADFDNDGDSGTDADIEAFFACLAGSCCARCGSADFNNDGDTATDSDIEAFFRVLAGSAC